MRLLEPTHRPGRRPLRLVRSLGAGGQPHTARPLPRLAQRRGRPQPQDGLRRPGHLRDAGRRGGTRAGRCPGGAGERHRGRPDHERLRHRASVRYRSLGLERQLPGRPDRGQPGGGRARRLGPGVLHHQRPHPPRGRRRGMARRHRPAGAGPDPRAGHGHPHRPRRCSVPLPAGGVAQISVPGAGRVRHGHRRHAVGSGLPDGLPVPRPADGVEPQLRGGRHRAEPLRHPAGGRWGGLHLHAGAVPRRRGPSRPPSSPEPGRVDPSWRARFESVGRLRGAPARRSRPTPVSRSCPCADGPRPAPPPGWRRARPSPGGGRPCGGPGPGPARPWPDRP